MPLFARRSKTIKRAKKTKRIEDDQAVDLLKHAHTTLSGDLKEAVSLPEGEDLSEWLAINTCEFFEQANMLYSTIAEFCTKDKADCQIMNAGPKFRYLWADGRKVKKPIPLSAPEYVSALFTWIQELIDNQSIFPTQPGVPFPKDFHRVVKQIFKRMFRVYAHIYHCHWNEVQRLGTEAHLNTCTKHFVFFVLEFNLMEIDDLEPLRELVQLWTRQ
eukprot:gnl/Dysnectes_brevis/251_a282_8731.p1 GENE.gnl/Dysnectes_brevis/251_a282_8731~~gnl/Dysnectes_brevis/251_a282_8731.p1  ORF type:complete len:216 (-),score=61.13 gnl/Dysnectes_brevis/251_a282_8731:84-731(-)